MMQWKNQIISLLLLLTIGFYLGSSTLFIHSHNIGGIKVVHSHPFSGTPASHSHGESSIQTISRLINPDSTYVQGVTFADCVVAVSRVYTLRTPNIYTATYTPLHLLRAPPAAV